MSPLPRQWEVCGVDTPNLCTSSGSTVWNMFTAVWTKNKEQRTVKKTHVWTGQKSTPSQEFQPLFRYCRKTRAGADFIFGLAVSLTTYWREKNNINCKKEKIILHVSINPLIVLHTVVQDCIKNRSPVHGHLLISKWSATFYSVYWLNCYSLPRLLHRALDFIKHSHSGNLGNSKCGILRGFFGTFSASLPPLCPFATPLSDSWCLQFLVLVEIPKQNVT